MSGLVSGIVGTRPPSPAQPAVLAVLTSQDDNKTGDGTSHRLGDGNVLTEIFDQGGDYVTTGTFTAPVTGMYELRVHMFTGGITSGMTYGDWTLTTSNRHYRYRNNPGGTMSSGYNRTTAFSVLADMDTGDTCIATVAIAAGAKVVDLAAGDADTHFSARLVG